MNELTFTSATALARMVRDGQASSVEVVEAHLRRIEAVNPRLNAVVALAADEAVAAAHAADEAIRRGRRCGPLHGVPVTIKDAIDTAGVVSTGGTLGRASHVPHRDATVVARLRRAGAILLGKTNLPELSLAGESDNLVFGRANNPYDLSRTPGGSSGGEAAIIAAGGSPLGLGSDVGGSIRYPAHCCGIAGLKPTSGRVPRTGHFPPADGLQDRMWQIGPMARYVEDLALALPLVAGVDGADPGVAPVPLRRPGAVDVARLRVAVQEEAGDARPQPEVLEGVRAAARALSAAGAVVVDDTPDCLARTLDIAFPLYWADGGASVRRLLDAAGTSRFHALTEEDLGMEAEHRGTSEDLTALMVRCDEFRRDMLAFMGRYDLIVCPVHTHAAVRHGRSNAAEYWPGWVFTMAHNLTGWPGAVVRAGTSPEGLPVGVQLVARPWREDVALAAAAVVEQALGGWQRPPL